MKISFEFKDIRDMMISLPKFMQLVGTDAPFEERMAAALAPDPQELVIRVTPRDGVPFTGEEKDKLAELLTDFVKDPDGFVAKHKKPSEDDLPYEVKDEEPAEKAQESVPEEKPAKTSKSSAKEEKPAKEAKNEVKEADVRAAFAKLIKAGKRDTVKEILDAFGADKLPDLKPEHYAEALQKAKEAAE